MQSSQPYPLRPLTIGEIVDRAVTIYVRNFVVFTLIVLTLLAPLAIVQYAIFPNASQTLAQIAQQASDAGSKGHPPVMPFTNGQFGLLILVGLIAATLIPFVNNAVALGVARVYRGEAPSYRAEFAGVFRRWLPLMGTTFIFAMILGGLYVATVFVLVVFIAIGAALASSALAIAVAMFVVAGLALLAVIPLFVMLLMTFAFSMYATSIEGVDPGKAIGLGFSRVFGRSEFRKSFLMALAYIALEFGVLLVTSAAGAILTFALKLEALQLIVSTIVNAMLAAFLAILLAVYYYDVRTRKEGLDLETDLQRLTAPA